MGLSVIKEAKLLANHSLIYGIGNLLNRIVGFLMIPIYTKFLSPNEYGVLEVATLTAEIIAMVASAGMTQSISRFYFRYEKEQDRNEVLSTGMIAFSGLSLFVLIPVLFASPYLAGLLLDGPDQKNIFIVAIINIWFASLAGVGFLYLRLLKKSLRFLQFSTTKLVLALSLNIYFVTVAKSGVIGILYSTLISSAVMTLLLTVPIFKKTGFLFSRNKFSEMFRFGAPMIPASMANFAVLVSDKYFLRFLVSLTDVGLYSLASRFAVIPGQLIVYPFMQIWEVRRFEIYKQPNAEEIMGRVFTYYCLIVTVVGLGVSILAKDAIELMATPKFWPAYKAVPVLILAQVIQSFFNHFNLGISISKRTYLFTYIDVTNAIVNLILNYVLIKKFGMMGAAYASLFSYSLRVMMVYVATLSLYHICFEARRCGIIFSSAGIIYFLSCYIQTGNVWLTMVSKLSLLLLFPVLLKIMFFFRPSEIVAIAEAIKKKSLPTLIQ